MRISVDTGGTFTDVVLEDDKGLLSVQKAPTTPHDPALGILEGIGRAARSVGLETAELLARATTLVHGTTRATNAILTHTTARTAFVTTQGHPDILLFRTGGREHPFNHGREFPASYVPRALTFEVDERMDFRGEVVRTLDESSVEGIAMQLRELEVEAAGVCLLWSIANPAHELRVGELLRKQVPGLAITLSHELNPVIREYHRASAACIDASLKPLMTDYLTTLAARLTEAGFGGRLLVSSVSGGLLESRALAAAPIHSINSGPAMAPVAARRHAQANGGSQMVIVIDTGGTSFDVSVVRDGTIPRTRETWLGERFTGHVTGFPSVDVRTTGAGGGSIARVDSAGLLTVGPQSAGSVPGPVCYGRGGSEVTVTDACMVLGYLDPARLSELGVDVDIEAARAAVKEKIGDPLGLSMEVAAEAVLRVTTETMVHAVEDVTVEQGIDPRGACLVSGGGAAGFNVVSIARRLGCAEVVIPQTSTALSASGGLVSDIIAEHGVALFTDTEDFAREPVNAALEQLVAKCRDSLESAHLSVQDAHVEVLAEARYPGQAWELEVQAPLCGFATESDLAGFCESFHALHEQIFAVRDTDSAIEIVGWRARARGASGPPCDLRLDPAFEPIVESERSAYLPGSGWQTVPVVGAAHISSIVGPAILELAGTSVVLDAGTRAERAPSGSIVISPGSAPAESAAREEAHAL